MCRQRDLKVIKSRRKIERKIRILYWQAEVFTISFWDKLVPVVHVHVRFDLTVLVGGTKQELVERLEGVVSDVEKEKKRKRKKRCSGVDDCKCSNLSAVYTDLHRAVAFRLKDKPQLCNQKEARPAYGTFSSEHSKKDEREKTTNRMRR
eukprot:scaffold81250_cov17-Tisochrysis_lutea.AAC.1